MGGAGTITSAAEDQDQVVRRRLSALLRNAYAPYSEFRVAAAVVDENDGIHYGVNVENQSFPVATCAEAAAISALLLSGARRVKKLYLLSEPNIKVLPCGACRQRLAEFGSPTMSVVTLGEAGDQVEYSLEQLFPHSFRFK
ncbi:MAG TPA: cytidine deaminase [Xanthobacteraceae bacterium]|nr:cytidine deaminase [Xanthobacteraceae bacterium]